MATNLNVAPVNVAAVTVNSGADLREHGLNLFVRSASLEEITPARAMRDILQPTKDEEDGTYSCPVVNPGKSFQSAEDATIAAHAHYIESFDKYVDLGAAVLNANPDINTVFGMPGGTVKHATGKMLFAAATGEDKDFRKALVKAIKDRAAENRR